MCHFRFCPRARPASKRTARRRIIYSQPAQIKADTAHAVRSSRIDASVVCSSIIATPRAPLPSERMLSTTQVLSVPSESPERSRRIEPERLSKLRHSSTMAVSACKSPDRSGKHLGSPSTCTARSHAPAGTSKFTACRLAALRLASLRRPRIVEAAPATPPASISPRESMEKCRANPGGWVLGSLISSPASSSARPSDHEGNDHLVVTFPVFIPSWTLPGSTRTSRQSYKSPSACPRSPS